MNIAARRSHLLHALKVLGAVIDTRSTMPALSCVLIEADGRTIGMIATDVQSTVRMDIDPVNPFTSPAKEFVCVPFKALKDVVKTCAQPAKRGDDPIITLEWTGRKLTVGGSVHFTLDGINPDLFPEIEEPKPATSAIQYQNLHEALAFVAPAICRDEARFHLRSVAFVGTDIVTTDGCRLHRYSNMPEVPGTNGHLVPHEAIKALRAGSEDKFGNVSAWFKEWTYSDQWNQIPAEKGFACFQFNYKHCHHSIWCRTVDARFPPYQHVFPCNPQIGFDIHCKTLANVCQAAKKSFEMGRGLGFDKESSSYLRATVDNPERKMSMAVEAEIHGDVRICLDPNYLLDVVRVLAEGTVSVRYCPGDIAPVRITAPNRTAVIMPMRRD